MEKEEIMFLKKLVKAKEKQLVEFLALEMGYLIKKRTGSWKYPLEMLKSVKEVKPNFSQH